MKKTTRLAAWLLGALLSSLPGTSFAQSKSAYNFKNVDWTRMVEVFHSALANGKNYPDERELTALLSSSRTLSVARLSPTESNC